MKYLVFDNKSGMYVHPGPFLDAGTPYLFSTREAAEKAKSGILGQNNDPDTDSIEITEEDECTDCHIIDITNLTDIILCPFHASARTANALLQSAIDRWPQIESEVRISGSECSKRLGAYCDKHPANNCFEFRSSYIALHKKGDSKW